MNSVVFLGLFLVPMLLIGRWSRAKPTWAFPLFALSDFALALALTQRQTDVGSWSVPSGGEWGSGATLVGIAALLRLAGAFSEPPRGMALLGWWQGILLLWWVGAAAAELFAIGGFALIAACTLVPKDAGRGLLLAGGLGALLSAGGFTEALPAVGFAGTAMARGERAVSSFILGAAPASAAWLVISPEVSWQFPLAMVGPVALLLVARALVGAGPPGWGGRLPAAAAAIATGALAMRQFSTFVWGAWGLGGAGLVMTLLTKPHPAGAAKGEAEPTDAKRSQTSRVAASLTGWLAFSGAVLLWLRLLLRGISTGFL